jgi:predicted nucleic acid-binding protein
MSARAIYLDSSALVKLAVREPESEALRLALRRRQPRVSSALARTEVARALLSLGRDGVRRGEKVLASVDLIRVNDRVLKDAGTMMPADLRSLDAIHLATARLLGGALARIVTYDARMATAARGLGMTVVTPGSSLPDNRALLEGLPDLGVDTGSIVSALDEERGER